MAEVRVCFPQRTTVFREGRLCHSFQSEAPKGIFPIMLGACYENGDPFHSELQSQAWQSRVWNKGPLNSRVGGKMWGR